MIIAPLPPDEKERLRALYRTELLDSEYEQDFDDIVHLASRLCKTPFSVISLIDADRQWYKAHVGMEGREAERDPAFCTHAILQNDFFQVQDALTDERFFDNPFVTGDPHVRYYGGMPLITDDGYKLGTLCVFDNKPRVLDEEQTLAMQTLAKQVMKLVNMRIMNKTLERSDRIQKRTISIMAHDIRNPLASISSIYELQKEGLLSDAEAADLHGMIPSQVQSTLDLLNNVVQWGSIQLKGGADDHHRTELNAVTANCFALLTLQATEKGNQLLNKVPADICVDANEGSVDFILRNLLTNACKFTKNGTITVSAERIDKNVIVRVTDTGVGMNTRQLNALRERKNITSIVGTNAEKGNGLGISLVYETINTLKGTIEIFSEEGNGSEFRITLPGA